MSKGNPCKCNFEAESLGLISLNILTLLIMKILLLIYIKNMLFDIEYYICIHIIRLCNV